jgi:RNA polymerase sigma-70 factor (sigma-E family)
MALTEQQRRDFEVFVATRSAGLMRTAYLLTGSRADAEDLLQTTLAKVFLSWARIEDKGAADAYARRTMTTTQISVWRRRRVDEVVTDRVPEVVVPAAPDLDDSLWMALTSLPKRQRAVIVLRYYEDLSEAEIAAVLGCSTGTVKSQAAKAMAKLRTALVATSPSLASDTRAALPLLGDAR